MMGKGLSRLIPLGMGIGLIFAVPAHPPDPEILGFLDRLEPLGGSLFSNKSDSILSSDSSEGTSNGVETTVCFSPGDVASGG